MATTEDSTNRAADLRDGADETVIGYTRKMLAIGAACEIEHLCQVLRGEEGKEGAYLVVRGLSARIEDLSRAIMTALGDGVVTTSELAKIVTRNPSCAA